MGVVSGSTDVQVTSAPLETVSTLKEGTDPAPAPRATKGWAPASTAMAPTPPAATRARPASRRPRPTTSTPSHQHPAALRDEPVWGNDRRGRILRPPGSQVGGVHAKVAPGHDGGCGEAEHS